MAVVDGARAARNGADRFRVPLYSVTEAGNYLGVSPSTFATWAYGYLRRPAGRPEVMGAPVVTAFPRTGPGAAVIPFVGLAEGLVVAGIRKAGVPLQRIRPALDRLQSRPAPRI